MTEHNCTKKLCKDCGKVKPVGEFYKKHKGACGRNTQCIACTKIRRKSYNIDLERQRTRRRLHARKVRAYGKDYGLTEQEYQKLLKRSGGRCEVCGITPDKLVIDHDHKTGKVRGLLCNGCNVALGMAKDNPSILERMVNYILKRSM